MLSRPNNSLPGGLISAKMTSAGDDLPQQSRSYPAFPGREPLPNTEITLDELLTEQGTVTKEKIKSLDLGVIHDRWRRKQEAQQGQEQRERTQRLIESYAEAGIPYTAVKIAEGVYGEGKKKTSLAVNATHRVRKMHRSNPLALDPRLRSGRSARRGEKKGQGSPQQQYIASSPPFLAVSVAR